MYYLIKYRECGFSNKIYGPFQDQNDAENRLSEFGYEKSSSGKSYRKSMDKIWAPGTTPISEWWSDKLGGAYVVETIILDSSKFGEDDSFIEPRYEVEVYIGRNHIEYKNVEIEADSEKEARRKAYELAYGDPETQGLKEIPIETISEYTRSARKIGGKT